MVTFAALPTRTSVKTANYTAAPDDLVPVDTATPNANVTVTLPTAPANNSRVTIKHVAAGAGKNVTVACGAGDFFNVVGGPTSGTLSLLNHAMTVQYDAGTKVWTVVSDDIPLGPLTSSLGLTGNISAATSADLTGLRALTTTQAAATPVQTLRDGTVYLWQSADTRVDNGTTVITPASAPASGRWIRQDPAAAIRPYGYALSRLTLAKSQRVKVLVSGTSIASFDTSIGKVFGQWLKNLYGDFGETEQAFGVLGGSWTAAFQSWVKQPFGGLSFTRLRGDSTMTQDLTMQGYFDTVEIEYSQETDGASSVTVQIDGTTVGTINCNGAQAYGKRVSFTAPTGLASHVLTILRPGAGAGYAYLERAKFVTSTNVGIDVTDASLGGSSINNMVNVRTSSAPQVNPIAISGNTGQDAYYNRTDFDIHITSFVVNDAGANLGGLANFLTLKSVVDRAVANSLANGQVLVFIVEMAGHFINPADPYSVQYDAIRQYLLKIGRENNNVFVLDWHAMTSMTDVAAYAARWYPTVTGLNVAANTYTGDFIHPSTEAMHVGILGLCAAFGIQPPPYDTVSALTNLNVNTITPNDINSGDGVLMTYRGTITKRFGKPTGVAQKSTGVAAGTSTMISYGQQPKVPYYIDDTVTNESDVPKDYLTTGLSTDKWGSYATLNAAVYSHAAIPWSQGARRTVLIRGRNISVRSTTVSTFYPVGSSAAMQRDSSNNCNVTAVNAPDGGPVWVAFDWTSTTDNTFLSVSGSIYEWYVTDTGGIPVKTKKQRTLSYRKIQSPQLMVGDAAFNQDAVGQIFYEDYLGARTTLIRKKLVSHATKWDFTTQTRKIVGLYECLDTTAAGLSIARLRNQGTMSTVATPVGGAHADTSDYQPKLVEWGGVSIAAAGTLTLVHQFLGGGGSVPSGLQILFINGGNNVQRWIDSAGNWQTTQQTINMRQADENETYVFTFPIPTALSGAADLNTTTPTLRLQLNGQTYFALSTLAKGSSGLI